MKKLMVLFLALMMIFTLAACGEKSGGEAPEDASTASADASNTEVQNSDELSKLKELYEGKWVNEDPHNGPFEMEIISTTSVKMIYEHTDPLHCDLFYSANDLTNASISLNGLSLGKYSIDTQTGILTVKPNDTDVFTYKRES